MKRAAAMLILIISLSSLCFVMPGSADQRKYSGIDISQWQGDIDFVKLRSSGVEMVYIRAGYGLSEDTFFRKNAGAALDAGMQVGFYFFVTARDTAQAVEQANYFAALIQGYEYACRPAIDFEEMTGLSRFESNAIALTFAQTLQHKTGMTPLFYSDAYRTETLWYTELNQYPLWVAAYGSDASPSVGVWKEWAGFQYSDAGILDGISTRVDLDLFSSEVLWQPNQDTELPFVDVNPSDWYDSAVLTLYRDGVLKGEGGYFFFPELSAERDMVLEILYRLDGKPSVKQGTNFSDVEQGSWYGDALLWAKASGIAKGYGDGLVLPEMAASRQELASFLFRFASERGLSVEKRADLTGYRDSVQIADWANDAMEWAVAEGILKGTSATTLNPQDDATGAEMAVMIARLLAMS